MQSQQNPNTILHNPHITRLKKEYGIVVTNTKVEKSEQLTSFFNAITIPKNILHHFEKELRQYADTNLNRIGDGDNYTNMEVMKGNTSSVAPARSTSSARVKAINLLFDLFKVSSIEEIYQYIITPEFIKLSGQNETSLQFLRKHLKTIVAEFKNDYEAWKNANSAAILLDLLLDVEIMETINDKTLGFLFLFSHSKLVADVIVNVYQKQDFAFDIDTHRYTFQHLEKFLKDDLTYLNKVNQKRSAYKLPQSLPANSRMPGKGTLEDEGLNCYELFQYDENTIYGVEQYLYRQYRDVFANKVTIKGQPSALNPFLPYHFYLLSAAPYMLQVPGVKDSYTDRFELFTNHIRELIQSTDTIPDKNIIFCGIMNIENTHYIPYFIYKNQSNEVQVITVDPSPQIHTQNSIGDEIKDGKLKTAKKLQRIFQFIFPGCTIHDPNIAQMLRERDCGPSSATTLRDAFVSCTTDTPLLQIIKGRLQLNTKFLTIQSKPLGINFYNQSFVYPEELSKTASDNRNWWMEKLSAIKTVSPITLRNTNPDESWDRPLSIHDVYDLDNQISTEYSYLDLVKSQERQDVRGVNISLVQSILRSDHEGKELMVNLIEHYKSTLTLPTSDDMIAFIKNKVSPTTLSDLIVGHDGDLKKLADEVVTSLLDEFIPEGLERIFKKDVIKKLPVSTDLNASKIVDTYLEAQKTIYTKLTIYQQRYVREKLLLLAAESVEYKLILAHINYIQATLPASLRHYLGQISPFIHPNNLVSEILKIAKLDSLQSDENKKVLFSLEFLHAHDTHHLEQFVSNVKDNIIKQVQTNTVAFTIEIFSQLPFVIETISTLFTEEGYFIPWDEMKLKNILQNADITTTEMLNHTEVSSYMGIETLDAINKAFYQHINKQIGIMLSSNIQSMCTDFERNIMQLSMEEIQNYLHNIQNDEKYSEQMVMQLINNYNPTLLTYKFIKNFLYNEVRSQVISILNKKMYSYYQETSHAILSSCKHDLEFSILGTNIEVSDPNLIAKHLYQKYTSYVSDNVFNYLTVSGKWTNLGYNFNLWFIKNIATTIQNNYQVTLDFITNIANATQHINQILSAVEHNSTPSEMKLIKDTLQEFQKLQDIINSIWMFNFRAECHKDNFHVFTELHNKQREFYDTLAKVCTSIYTNHYSAGDITPSSLTSYLRYLFCCLLSIKTPKILTKTTAYELDQIILSNIQTLHQSEYYPIQTEVPLIRLHHIDELGDTYKQSLTPSLLIHCLSYWYSHTSFLYVLTSPSLWFKEEYTPPLVLYIIDILNQLSDLSVEKLPEAYISKLKKLLHCSNDIPLAIYESKDYLDKIQAALIRTSAIQNHNDTELNFSEIKKILSLLEAEKNAKRQPKKIVSKFPPLSPEEFNKIKIKRVIDFNKQRAEALKTAREKSGNNALTYDEAGIAPVHLGTIESQIRAEHGQNKESFSLEKEVTVTSTQLKRAQYESFSFFQDTLTPIEKLLLQIQSKHDYKINFNLDNEDIRLLEKCILQRWKLLLKNENVNADKHYCETPKRDDHVYIALAEILAYHYRKNGIFKMSYELLMPGSTRFKPSNTIQQTNLPAEICKTYRLEASNSLICMISLSNLITTCSGYALDIDWIKEEYVKSRTLTNPYTKKKFTNPELADIFSHPKAIDMVELISKYNQSSITPRLIQILTDYLNGAIFDRGFGHYYSDDQNRQALKAYTTFTQQLSLLPLVEQKALMDEIIPHERSTTVRDIFAQSEIRQIDSHRITDRSQRVLAPQDGSCLTAQGVYLAKVVIAYEGSNHKLINRELIRRTESIEKVPTRTYVNTNAKPLSKQETYILDLADRNPRYNAIMNKR